MENVFFEVKNVSFAYPKYPLCLRDISFSLNEGEKYILLAQKDMGKTTFLEVCSSFLSGYEGKIFLKGEKIEDISDEQKNISLLLSEPVFMKNKTILKNFLFLLDVCGKKDKTNFVIKFLKRNGFDNIDKTKVKNLTLLQRRKLAIIRSEIKNPDIIFCDDQFDGLDENEVINMADFFVKKINCKKTAIFAMSDATYKKVKNYIKNAKIDGILYLIDSKLHFFKDYSEFENKIINFNQNKFFDFDFNVIFKGSILRGEDNFYFLPEDKNFKEIIFDKSLDRFMCKFFTQNGESEDVIVMSKLPYGDIDANNFFDNTMIFSAISGERIIIES